MAYGGQPLLLEQQIMMIHCSELRNYDIV